MNTIIALGGAACNIAEKFLQYPQYSVYLIDSEKRKTEANFKKIAARDSHEEYEKRCPAMKSFFKNIKGSVLFIVTGSGDISGASLKILSYLKHCRINILFIRPDLDLRSDGQAMQNKIVFQILQQYARSGTFERLYVVDNLNLESILGELPVIGYYEKLNYLVSSTVHMLNIYSNINSVINTFSTPLKIARISTFGLIDVSTGEEKLFYDLQYPREKLYFYAINEEKLISDSSLMRTVTKQVKDKSSEKLNVSYGIFSTNYDQDYGYVISHATYIQENKELDFTT